MSEIINNSTQRKELLRHLLLRLHEGEAPDVLRSQLIRVLQGIPYNEVVEVEQDLIMSGDLSESEVLMFCDLHTAVLDGSIDQSHAKAIPHGHPVETFKRENRAIEDLLSDITELFAENISADNLNAHRLKILHQFHTLWDIDKHYKRKEYLIFPYLEKHGITGPPKVMWGKHDEIRDLLKASMEVLNTEITTVEEFYSIIELVLVPPIELIDGMIMKEEQILLPMCMDTLLEEEWYKIYLETPEFGYCLVDSESVWKPDINIDNVESDYVQADAIRLSNGSLNMVELESILKLLPFELTFVDKDDKVRFFSHGPNRVFDRNRSIIGRDVRMCHPPGSVHIVEEIINDFKTGKENKAAFWISKFMGHRFVYIEYVAVRGPENEYLGVLEVTQEITKYRALQGDQRLLSYSKS